MLTALSPPSAPTIPARSRAARLVSNQGVTSPAASIGLSPEAARSRQRILEAAREEFARHGFAGARVDRIAATAGINKRMLYHYVGNKDALFTAVLEASYAHKREREGGLDLQSLPPRAAITRFVTFTWNYYLAHPEFLTLLNSANLHRGQHLQPGPRFRRTNEPLTALLGEVLARGEREGVFRAGVDPVQLYITIAGLSWFYLSNQHTLSAIFGRALLAARPRALRLRHMTDVVLCYLAPPMPAGASPSTAASFSPETAPAAP